MLAQLEYNSKQVIHFMSVDTEGSLRPYLADRCFPVGAGGVSGFPAKASVLVGTVGLMPRLGW